ncbi:MAG: hypothetical protein V1736_08660 [Pseudomonadota bacterium]
MKPLPRRFISLLLPLLLALGCTGIPFQKITYSSLGSADPADVLEQFKEKSPVTSQLLNTVLFQYGFRKLSGIGYIEIDPQEEKFSLVCMNPMGMKLFDISGAEKALECRFAIDQLRRDEVVSSIAEDVRRIYFHAAPALGARVEKKRDRIVFRQAFGKGVLVYVFGGPDIYLAEKSYVEEGLLCWKVSFHEYAETGGKIYPKGIFYRNCTHQYTLAVELKEIMN